MVDSATSAQEAFLANDNLGVSSIAIGQGEFSHRICCYLRTIELHLLTAHNYVDHSSLLTYLSIHLLNCCYSLD